MRGALIVFEGIDGSGKQTQIDLLLEKLSNENKPAVLFTYPDLTGEYAEQLSAILSKDQHLPPQQEFDAFAKDIEKDTRKIMQLVTSGNIVVCDRYIFSTICYQSAREGGVEHQPFTVDQAKKHAQQLTLATPGLAILLDLPSEVGLKRKHAQKTRQNEQIHSFEKDAKFLEKVRQNYLQLAFAQFYTKWIIINATQKPEKIHVDIYAYIHSITQK